MCPLTLAYPHPWDLTPEAAIQLQQKLRSRVLAHPLSSEDIRYIAGADVGFRQEKARAVVVVLAFPSLQLVDQAIAEIPVTFPYVPGLLSFREMPAILAALEQLKILPDLIMCDGQGMAHPRRFGIACHLGVLLDWPTLGCAKSILVGRHGPLEDHPGSTADLVAGEEVIGKVVRTRKGVKPLVVSIGHRVDLPSAVQLVLACTRGYRLPETTRLADRLASRRGPLSGQSGPLL